ncbi:hypothetical protein LPTSP3_g06320 [Leptospira kobayashii]|uniref:Dolichyl-phosphate-mannose-protein mannosyltransferase n=1 Tax=Leptospira kobayashii TaxID=1917830 RepID=A0ABN6K9T1_9LEPT|nr:hypothetical protein [Leptospira kobayashii]BDA77702.1 hypothetical protein LPTSP3_g06320 [Leptospira kobayashii]
MYSFLEEESESFPVLFASLFFTLGSPLFTGRLLFGRGIVLFLGFIFLYLRKHKEKNRIYIFLISFVSVWTYSGFPILLILSFFFLLGDYLRTKELSYKPVLYTISGLTLGMILHPSFPNQFEGYFLELIVQAFPPSDTEAIAEWLAPERSLIWGGIWFLLIFIIYHTFHGSEFSITQKIFLSLTIIYLVFGISSLRLFEYYFLFGYLFCFSGKPSPRQINYAGIAVLLLILFPITYGKMKVQYEFTDPNPAFNAADWIKKNLPEEKNIFLSWGDYPYFVFRAPEKNYLFGLNPIYAWAFNQKKYMLQRSFFEGSSLDYEQIPGILGYKYAVINLNYYKPVGDALKRSKKAELVYENNKYRVFRMIGANK